MYDAVPFIPYLPSPISSVAKICCSLFSLSSAFNANRQIKFPTFLVLKIRKYSFTRTYTHKMQKLSKGSVIWPLREKHLENI